MNYPAAIVAVTAFAALLVVLAAPAWAGWDEGGVLEKALIGAAVGGIIAIVFSPIIWLMQRRDKRKAEEKASRERGAQRAISKVQREDDEKWAREFASTPAPDIGRKPD